MTHAISNLRITPLGRELERCTLAYDRMEMPDYAPAEVIKGEDYPWPGDMEGRWLLSVVSLARATGRDPKNLASFVKGLRGALAKRGYLGPEARIDSIDEQQLAGHSWLLRGLCEWYAWSGDPEARSMALGITERLVLPLRGHFARYESLDWTAKPDANAVGQIHQSQVNEWKVSTDVGCAFILLDGLSHVHSLFPSEASGDLLDEMIHAYGGMDFAGRSFQTHATLTGLRGVLRHYGHTGRADLLDLALRVWNLYTTGGMTAHFGNHNWFGRPTMTEPCAIVDSFMVACMLWEITGEAGYLHQAQAIYYNALLHGQRPNGGFGCDTCPGPGRPDLSPTAEIYEAWWCCSMRAGEGLSQRVLWSAWAHGDTLVLPFLGDTQLDFDLPDGHVRLEVSSAYPLTGQSRIEVAEGPGGSLPLEIWMPEGSRPETVVAGTNGGHAAVSGDSGCCARMPLALEPGTVLALDIPMRVWAEPCGPDHVTLRHGPLVLGSEPGSGPVSLPLVATPLGGAVYALKDDGITAGPMPDLCLLPEEEARRHARQVVFAKRDRTA
jgi:uncharacterized protein